MDLGAPLDQPQLSAALCEIAFSLARAHDLEIFDPQLGRRVHKGDTELIQRQVQRGRAFAEAAPLSYGLSAGGTSASLRLWLIIGAACLVALMLARALSCAL